mmetsp:Transcript_10095/g.10045  ORF Transcript_10095/g.10045 Transcript_10095/m.10045 type:complete len:166 (-) Transcript_10095:121-618(-)
MLERCTKEIFNHTDPEEFDLKGLKEDYCIKNKSLFRIGGSFKASNFEFLNIKLRHCINSTDSNVTCATQEDIEAFFLKQSFEILTINYYFDKDDPDNPIKSYIDDSIYFGIMTNQFSTHNMKIKLSKARYDDSIMPWASKEEKEFIEIDEIFPVYYDKKPTDPYV